jgi:hypothetical protein
MTPRRKIAIFLVLTFVFSALAYLPILTAGTMEAQGGLFTLLLMWSPGLAALLTQFIAQRSLRGLGWRPGSFGVIATPSRYRQKPSSPSIRGAQSCDRVIFGFHLKGFTPWESSRPVRFFPRIGRLR